MNVDVLNESGADVDVVALTRLCRFTMRRMRLHPATELTLRLIDPQGREVMGMILYNGDNSLDVSALSRGSLFAEVRDAHGTILHRSPLLLQ